MTWYWWPAYFLGGVFLVNAVPHLVCGVTGRAFQTPFATPSGVGLSSSTVNVLWGACNLGGLTPCCATSVDSRRVTR